MVHFLASLQGKIVTTCDVVCQEGRLDVCNLNVLNSAPSEMGSAHKVCGFGLTLWADHWVDHMWGIVRERGTLSALNAFKGGYMHQSLKSQIRKRSC